jgi:predicted acylesterase/phospholipase RssA
MKFGLACAGGVVEGAVYEIGVLCALEEAIDGLDFTQMDAYVGVSSGGLVTACLANGISARAMSRAAISQASPELNLQPERLFTLALGELWRRLVEAPGATWRALWKYASSPLDLSPVGALAEMSSLLPVGLFDNAPLEAYLRRAFSTGARTNDFRALERRGRPLRVISMRLDSSELVAFGQPETSHVPISKAVQASTALPGLYCPVEVDGADHIDGVARRTLNAGLALEAGVDLLFCVNPIVPVNAAPAEGHAHPPLTDHGLPSVLSQTFRAAIHSRRRTGFRDHAHRFPDADVILVEPDLEDPGLFFSNIFSFSNRYAVCERAYRATRANLRGRQSEMRAKLWRHGLRLNDEVLADEERTLFGRLRPAHERPYGESTFDKAHDALDRLDHALDDYRLGAPPASSEPVRRKAA